MRFKNKITVITGGSSGMGNAVARLLAREGSTVYVLDKKETKDARHLSCDVGSYAQVQKAISQVLRQKGRIDLLFCSAGYHLFSTLEETSIEDFERILSVNLKGVFYVLKEVLPGMRERSCGSIVLMGSDQALIGKASSAAYGLTKGAIGQLTKSTAIDYAEYGIRVNCICPGTIDTPMLSPTAKRFHQASGIPLADIYEMWKKSQPVQRLGTVEELASAVAFMLSDECPYMTGTLLSVDGGYTCQ